MKNEKILQRQDHYDCWHMEQRAHSGLNRIVKELNKPGQLKTKAHLRRGKWLTISTDVATPEAMDLYFNIFANE